ncbi:MAG: glutathione S-transferase [Rhizobiales bacterium]|nr:glutathione S-transferase [Hyphomicrobiales bacterium]
MADFHIYLGYRSVSSWSMRGWLPLKKAGVAFEETLLRYRTAEGKARLVALSPTGKVPLLVHQRDGGEVKVWDSIAIGEYLAELLPAARLWPADPAARAFARSVAAEMHSGFAALRNELGMALLERKPKVVSDPKALADIARVETIWSEARERWGKAGGGPFLFGHYTVADAMYAPVVTRFRTYGIKLGPVASAYMEAILGDPDMQLWEANAVKEGPPEPPTP